MVRNQFAPALVAAAVCGGGAFEGRSLAPTLEFGEKLGFSLPEEPSVALTFPPVKTLCNLFLCEQSSVPFPVRRRIYRAALAI